MKPIDLNIGDYHKTVEAFHGESDRAAAVLAGSFVENYLAKYLRSFMIADDSVTELFDGFGPLADFKQRYETAHAFGFIDVTQRSDLKFIAKVRNYFAHHPLEANFDKAPVSDWCACLSTKNLQSQVPNLKHTNREVYLLAVSMCVASWHNSMLKKAKWPNKSPS